MQHNEKLLNHSKQWLIRWVNELLGIKLNHIEDLGSGAVFCLLINYVHPNIVPIHKINLEAKNEYECLGNFRLLQNAFSLLKISRPIDMAKLSKAKYQDNFEMINWFHAYVQNHLNGNKVISQFSQDYLKRLSFISEVTFKPSTSNKCKEHFRCNCCSQKRSEAKKAARIRQLQVKLEMIEEVIISQEPPDQKLYLISQIMQLKSA